MKRVAVLFARADSCYRYFPEADVFDISRDARTYCGDLPVVAHPPCRAWGRLRHLANPRSDERDLAFFAVEQVRRCGGVLEHPAKSSLWPAAGLPAPGWRDAFGGWTLPVLQSAFGHRAPKATFLYICGVEPCDTPIVPFHLGVAAGRVELMGKAAREHTPASLAAWLLKVAALATHQRGAA